MRSPARLGFVVVRVLVLRFVAADPERAAAALHSALCLMIVGGEAMDPTRLHGWFRHGYPVASFDGFERASVPIGTVFGSLRS